jgi:hypothetical protein
MIRLMICRNHHYARIAWDELYPWQRPESVSRMNFIFTDDAERSAWPLRGQRYDEGEVMFCEGWEDGKYAARTLAEMRMGGLNTDNCGTLVYD